MLTCTRSRILMHGKLYLHTRVYGCSHGAITFRRLDLALSTLSAKQHCIIIRESICLCTTNAMNIAY
jgi:hypothetical protein